MDNIFGKNFQNFQQVASSPKWQFIARNKGGVNAGFMLNTDFELVNQERTKTRVYNY